jgi:hypothetical protein
MESRIDASFWSAATLGRAEAPPRASSIDEPQRLLHSGGPARDRTADLLNAIQPLSQTELQAQVIHFKQRAQVVGSFRAECFAIEAEITTTIKQHGPVSAAMCAPDREIAAWIVSLTRHGATVMLPRHNLGMRYLELFDHLQDRAQHVGVEVLEIVNIAHQGSVQGTGWWW